MTRRLLNLLIALDQLCWVILTLGNGCPDETISASLWRMEQQGKRAGRWFRPVVDWLFFRLFGQAEHCWQSYVDEVEKRQLPKIYRKVSNYDTH